MDSVTQFALGAVMGEVTLGRRIGRLAPVLGGIVGTLPDLDIIYRFADPVADFTYHRSVSHSLFVLALAAPVLAELLRFAFKRLHDGRAGWYAFAFLALLTHPLLDCFTTYGTQVLWPLDSTPVSWSTIFIIDPAYTLPLLAALICALAMKRTNPQRTVVALLAISLSSGYLGWTVYAKARAAERAVAALTASDLETRSFTLVPGPFTSLLWRVTAVDDTHYHNLYISLLDSRDTQDRFVSHPRNLHLLEGIEQEWAVQRLAWFSHGFYAASRIGNDVAMTDLRMGFEPNYVFRFKVGTIGNPHTRPVSPTSRYGVSRDASMVTWAWQRLWDGTLPPHP